jgi:hypothetical protein
MASYGISINQIDTDSDFFVWASGQDLRRFNGTSWEYYNYQNSAVPSGAPYFLDTRSISIDPDNKVWCGVAEGPISGLNEVSVFYINSGDVEIGESWNFSDLGIFNEPQEISTICACRYGDNVHVFSTPLNGIGGTGATGYTEINGVTGGRLFCYQTRIDNWFEVVPGYTWPHVYDVKSKGIDGKDYFYYIATAEGLFAVPQGELEAIELTGGELIIEQAKVYNTKTSGILSDYIYSLDRDENDNLWIGTSLGLSFFDGNQFWNYPTPGPVTKVISRPNGHVFYSSGDGELGQGSGLWHFNGTSHNQFDTSNSNLPNDNVLDIKLVEKNITQNDLTVYDNSLWVLCLNEIVSFNYDIPHVYGSSKYEGATGWNFTYFTATGGTAPLAKVDKYTWVYPEWRIYDDYYTSLKFPGMDPRNLFLTTKLSDIANGKAGEQQYWDNYPIPTYDDEVLTESISEPSWASDISITQLGITAGTIQITSSTTIKSSEGIKYYIGGYLKGNVSANFGYYNSSESAILTNQNPTIGGSVDALIDGSSSLDEGEMGFIVSYNEAGNVDTILPFRGYATRIQDIKASEDGDYIVASGIFNRFIENGPYVWDSLESENSLRNGPTGAPAGVTNINVPGVTSGDYPWVYGTTGYFISGTWDYANTIATPTPGDFSISLSGGVNWQNVNKIKINYTDNTSSYQNLDSIYTSNSIYLGINLTENARYRINSIITLSGNNGFEFDVSYDYNYPGYQGNFVAGTGSSFRIDFYEYTETSYPLVQNVNNRAQYWNTNDVSANSIFVVKIGRDLGNTSTFTDLGTNSSFSYDIRSSFRGLEFRNFPAKYESEVNTGDVKNSNIALSRYSINLGLESGIYFTPNTSTGDLSTLKNTWNRTNDYPETSDTILGSTQPISTFWQNDSVLSYIRLSVDDLSLLSTTTSNSIYPGVGAITANRKISDIKSLPDNNTVLITGNSDQNFNFGGIGLTGINSVYTPYYIILNSDGTGVTGGFIGGATGYRQYPKASNDESTYYVTTNFGASGSYFGNEYVAGTTGNYFLTARITEQGVPISTDIIYSGFESNFIQLLDSENLSNNQYFIAYSELSFASDDNIFMIKSNGKNKILDSVSMDADYRNNLIPVNQKSDSISFSVDQSDNIFLTGFNYGATGASGYYNIGSTSGVSLLSPQYNSSLGINLGNIISRAGSGSWTWCDVHSTDKGMQIPLLSTVIFSNYASNIYGKQNNNWILSDAITGNELLNVKATPYFIYTFSEVGKYTIYNSVEDSAGNVYFVTKPGYIEIVDHKAKRPDDNNPDIVDSFDYGEPEPFAGRDYEAAKLAKDMAKQQQDIFDVNNANQSFGTGIIIENNPDATFRNE